MNKISVPLQPILKLLVLIIVFANVTSAGAADKKKSAQNPPQLQQNAPAACTPLVAMVAPEYVVLGNAAQTVSFTIVGGCLANNTNVLLVDESTNSSTPLSSAKSSNGGQLLKGDATLSQPGSYVVCVAASGANSCNPLPQGPTVFAISGSLCSDPAIPTASAPSLASLRSEASVIESDPPGAADRCDLHAAKADKAMIVDADTGLTCTATTTSSPDDGCLQQKREKKPLQLGAGDTVRLYVVNKNPFLESYNFSSTDSQIKDDDIGTFLGMLVPGLSGSSQKPSANNTNSGSTDTANNAVTTATKSTGNAANVASAFAFRPMSTQEITNAIDKAKTDQDAAQTALQAKQRELHPAATEKQSVQDLLNQSADAAEAINNRESDILKSHKGNKPPDLTPVTSLLSQRLDLLNSAANQMQQPTSAAGKVDKCVAAIEGRVDNLVKNYAFFAQEYNRERNSLLSSEAKCTDLSQTAAGLWHLMSYEQAKILDARIDMNLRDAMVATTSSMPVPDPNNKNKTPSPDTATLTADLNSLTASLCTLKAMRTQIAPTLTSNLGSVESVLINPNAFRSEILIGPYSDATQVDWTLQRSMTQSPIKTVDSAAFDSALDDCLSQPSGTQQKQQQQQQPQTPGGSQTSQTGMHRNVILMNASFPLPAGQNSGTQSKKNPSGSSPNQTNPSGNGQQQQQTPPAQPSDSSTTTRGRRINFGSERFIVSAGLTGTPLSQQQFGKGVGQAFDSSGKPVSGQATANIITLTTNQSYRLSPMAFLNTRVHQWPGKAEALYATIGITAKSDSNGVAPEYLLGISQSLLERHLMLSVGAYAGRQDKLTGGLFVNEAIPSNLTGSIPTQSNYQFHVGFAVSWRIPGLAK